MAASRSSSGAEKTTPVPIWITVSTLTEASASAWKSSAGSADSTSNTASSTSWVTPAIIAFSSILSSSSPIQVPSSSANVERTCSVTPWLRANSTPRSWSTFAPDAASSSISS